LLNCDCFFDFSNLSIEITYFISSLSWHLFFNFNSILHCSFSHRSTSLLKLLFSWSILLDYLSLDIKFLPFPHGHLQYSLDLKILVPHFHFSFLNLIAKLDSKHFNFCYFLLLPRFARIIVVAHSWQIVRITVVRRKFLVVLVRQTTCFRLSRFTNFAVASERNL